MAYRIEYDDSVGKYEIITKKKKLFPGMIIWTFALFLVLTWNFWPEGAAMLRELLIPGDQVVTTQALNTLTDSLKDGADLKAAITVFCRDVIDGAKLSD